MSAETQLYSALSGLAGLTEIVSTRIYPDAIPEGKLLPAVVFMRASTTPTHTINGALICEDVRFSISSWAQTREQAEAVADQIDAALTSAGNPKADRSSGFDSDVGLFAVTTEVDWFYPS